MKTRWIIILCLLLCVCSTLSATKPTPAVGRVDTTLLHRVFSYASTIDTSHINGTHSYAYHQYIMRIERRNPILLAVPDMYAMAHGGARKFAGESYFRIDAKDLKNFESKRLLNICTIPHHKDPMPVLMKYLTPNIYEETLIENTLISPFNSKNRKYYKYQTKSLSKNIYLVTFTPRVNHTQLLRGEAAVDYSTGRIHHVHFRGVYDMIHFTLYVRMGDHGVASIIPAYSRLDCDFHFIGNKVSSTFTVNYGLKTEVPDTLADDTTRFYMDLVRPRTLTQEMRQVFKEHFDAKQRALEAQGQQDSLAFSRANKVKGLLWDNIGQKLLDRYKMQFGVNDQGNLRVDPLFNPLYMGYSKTKGLTYKFKVKAGYDFDGKRSISLTLKGGYAFKSKLFYYKLPLTFTYNNKHNGYVSFEIGNGNRITNTSILDEVKIGKPDTINWDNKHLDFFKDNYMRLYHSYDFSDRWTLQTGIIMHNRQPVDKTHFTSLGLPYNYRSTAPEVEIQYRPLGWSGPAITLNYERSFDKFLESNIAYERIELDGSYIHRLNQLQSLSLRVGTGFFTSTSDKNYFLDFTNFRANNLANGWNDEWSGEFELLRSEWYNTSRYYRRCNVTYESPLLVASWIPFVGHHVETERVYISALSTHVLRPYFEVGYGFTTRIFSMGAFVSNMNGKFKDVGFKLGLELFRKW